MEKITNLNKIIKTTKHMGGGFQILWGMIVYNKNNQLQLF